ncbi:transcriptional regulator [Gemmobacter nanjingensis]|jgi:transcriptional regulator with XRE-family HTH domain|uniref:Transcriptional regulator n=1 Tax=Gemmobacter nanjingensis TaxID=488454 RepID=A0ABQ3FS15_9RHOB|nr:helix-turn-helix transcriptional regulator [Gemmobacter nanjingensis]GHC37626.1 transcriptional regulator [Gemmobacter nanjingensis]
MTGEQIRAARALLKWSARELADASGIGWATIQRLESKNGPLAGYGQTHEAIRKALEAQGVQFLEAGQVAAGPGVALGGKE